MKTVRFLSLLPILATAVNAEITHGNWSISPSLTARAGYDDNVFLQDRAPVITPGAVPDGADSWFTRLAAGVDAIWKLAPDFNFTAGYGLELVRYEDFSEEQHNDHRLDLGVAGKTGDWSYGAKAGVLFVDGSKDAPIYGHVGGGPAIGGVAVRSRREQVTSKFSGQVTRSFESGFVRAVGDVLSNDFQTYHAPVAGYANYVDRSEWSAGLDRGRNVSKDFALVAGVRGGEQRQSDLLSAEHNYSSSLARILVGVEGKPRSDLTLHILGGPDFRHFGTSVAPGFDRTQSARYLEASATWTPRASDTLTLAYKDYLWLSSGGRCAYQHSVGNVQWKHVLDKNWCVTSTADVQAADARDYAPAATERFEWIYTGSIDLARKLGANTKLDLEFTREWSDSVIVDKPGREYTRWLATASVRHAF